MLGPTMKIWNQIKFGQKVQYLILRLLLPQITELPELRPRGHDEIRRRADESPSQSTAVVSMHADKLARGLPSTWQGAVRELLTFTKELLRASLSSCVIAGESPSASAPPSRPSPQSALGTAIAAQRIAAASGGR